MENKSIINNVPKLIKQIKQNSFITETVQYCELSNVFEINKMK
jgi:hypothetical protein